MLQLLDVSFHFLQTLFMMFQVNIHWPEGVPACAACLGLLVKCTPGPISGNILTAQSDPPFFSFQEQKKPKKPD